VNAKIETAGEWVTIRLVINTLTANILVIYCYRPLLMTSFLISLSHCWWVKMEIRTKNL